MVQDIAIIGAGPAGLAVAARLREPSPSALFTDIEHQRFWNRAHDKNTIDRSTKHSPGAATHRHQALNPSMIVFDAVSDSWLSSWRSKFRLLNISHLRSPLFFHPDPADRDGLLSFAHCEERMGELCEIEGVVGRERSKHARKKKRRVRKGANEGCGLASARHLNLDDRDRNDYFTPSAKLFDDYIDDIVERYHLKNVVQRATIVDLSYDNTKNSTTKLFTLKTSTGQIHLARSVVLAIGPVNPPQIPSSYPLLTGPNQSGSATHIFDRTQPLIPAHLTRKLTSSLPTKVLVVGGGLTSAQIIDKFLTTHNITQVHLILRYRLKSKHFDVDLPWVAKLRNREMARFWSADSDEERYEILMGARGGGSVTSRYEKLLRMWEKHGRLVIHEGWELDCAKIENEGTKWDGEKMGWSVVLKRSTFCKGVGDNDEKVVVSDVDHIIFATSTAPNIDNIPFLKTLREIYPCKDIQGLPVLTHDLMWRGDVPMFVTGALAGLRLGPGAGNLGGARLGAERIAWGVESFLAEIEEDDDEGEDGCDDEGVVKDRRDSGYVSEDQVSVRVTKSRSKECCLEHYTHGLGSRFKGLMLVEED